MLPLPITDDRRRCSWWYNVIGRGVFLLLFGEVRGERSMGDGSLGELMKLERGRRGRDGRLYLRVVLE